MLRKTTINVDIAVRPRVGPSILLADIGEGIFFSNMSNPHFSDLKKGDQLIAMVEMQGERYFRIERVVSYTPYEVLADADPVPATSTRRDGGKPSVSQVADEIAKNTESATSRVIGLAAED
ncbi:MAG TPA: hypothetical protein VND15_04480 [Candidatus Acidoferrales bacterium]|nr:hypothetical protein [Candidatus Acidoferrales bacterium]